MILTNMAPYNNGDFVQYCEECGCSSDQQMLQCIMDYAEETMDDREIDAFTDYIAHHAGRYV